MWTEKKVTRREPEVKVLPHVLSKEFAIVEFAIVEFAIVEFAVVEFAVVEFAREELVKEPVCHFGKRRVVEL